MRTHQTFPEDMYEALFATTEKALMRASAKHLGLGDTCCAADLWGHRCETEISDDGGIIYYLDDTPILLVSGLQTKEEGGKLVAYLDYTTLVGDK